MNVEIKFSGLKNFHGENLRKLNPRFSKPSPDLRVPADVTRWLSDLSDMSGAADATDADLWHLCRVFKLRHGPVPSARDIYQNIPIRQSPPILIQI